MRVISNRVLVEVLEVEEKTSTGIILPLHKQMKNKGRVLIVGEKAKHVKEGNIVRYYEGCGTEYIHDGKKCLFLKEDTDIEIILE